MMEKLNSSPGFKPELLNFFPNISIFNLATFTFFVYIFMVWWSQAPAGYFFVQRLLACKTEKDSLYAFLWYNIVQYVIKTWPWILVGILSLYYLPDLKDADTAFPKMIDKFMPAGLKGVLVASLLAAFASAVNTLLNWGSSYLINDFYKPFVIKNRTQQHYVRASQIATLLLTFVALFVTTKLHSLIDAYFFINVLFGGLGTVLILRWYWWRVNTYSEISAYLATFVIGIGVIKFLPDNIGNSHIAASIRQALGMQAGEVNLFAVRLIITVVLVAAIWIIVTLLTSKTPSAKTIEFYKKMKISGPGWKKVAQVTGIPPIAGEFKENIIAWLACTVLIMALMLSIGYFLFHEFTLGVIYLAASVISGVILTKLMSKMNFL
jgi:solute:Na+ symporter, SSS family